MRIVEQFFRIVAPDLCLSCGAEGSLLCAWCRESSLPETVERCYRCNALSPGARTCRSCRRNTPISHLYVRTEYSKHTRQLVHVMKFKYSGAASDLIAEELMNTLPALPPDTIIVHVPAVTTHIRQRGFDQSERIAASLSKLLAKRHVPALRRLGQSRQVGASRRLRLQQTEGSFRISHTYLLEGVRVLLVDDVLTTGATLEAAARCLKSAGVKTVDAIVFAQAR